MTTKASAEMSVLLINLGSPEKPEPPEVRTFLKEFLSDPRVIEVSPWIWKPLLHGIILNTRPKKSAAKYRSIWTEEGSPLVIHTRNLALEVQKSFEEKRMPVRVEWAMRYGEPSIGSVMSRLVEEGIEKILVVPLYPQYSATTTGSVLDGVGAALAKMRKVPEVRILRDYFGAQEYIEAMANSIRGLWHQKGTLGPKGRLFLSYHGMPQSYSDKGDPYLSQCEATTFFLTETLGMPSEQVVMGFQSRFGKAEWLKPYTVDEVAKLAASGVERLDIICPGFACDCLETLEEIGIEVQETFLSHGGTEFNYIPCLNSRRSWANSFTKILAPHLISWP